MSIGFARPDDEIPPAGRVVRIMPGDVRIARQGMADQNGVVGCRAERAVGLVGHPHDGQGAPFFQGKRFLEGDILGIFQRNSRAKAVAAIENASVGRHAFKCIGRGKRGKGASYPCDAASAWSKSALMSSMSSSPALDADVVLGHAGAGQFGGRLLAVGGRGGMDDQRLGVADVGQVRGQLGRLDELLRGRPAALDAEAQDRPRALARYFCPSL